MKAMFLFLMAGAAAVAQTSDSGAMIFGKVESPTGVPILGAWVTIYRDVTDPRATVPHFTTGTVAGKAGQFAFEGLASGTYHFCANLPGSTWLNPCDWESKRVTVQIKPNQILRGTTVVMKPGAAVPIRVEDPNQYLAQYEKNTPGAQILIGVTTVSGMFQLARLVKDDGKGRDHQIVIPFDSPTKILVAGNHFTVGDDKAKALVAGQGGGSVTVPTGSSASQVKFTITGFKP